MLVRDILRDIGHDPVPVTSGSKGIHLYAPLDGSLSTEQAAISPGARGGPRVRAPRSSDQLDEAFERDGKVFIDWSQNNGAKTTVSPYSMRGRERPTVAALAAWRSDR